MNRNLPTVWQTQNTSDKSNLKSKCKRKPKGRQSLRQHNKNRRFRIFTIVLEVTLWLRNNRTVLKKPYTMLSKQNVAKALISIRLSNFSMMKWMSLKNKSKHEMPQSKKIHLLLFEQLWQQRHQVKKSMLMLWISRTIQNEFCQTYIKTLQVAATSER